MAKIFIADTNAGPVPHQHLYLIFQDDSGSQFVLRGGPDGDNGDVIQIDYTPYETSVDRLGEDTPAERDTTLLEFGTQDAQVVWEKIISFVRSQGTIEFVDGGFLVKTSISYDKLGPNSNSVINSVLDSVGIDLSTQMPREDGTGDRLTMGFPGVDTLLGTAGDDTLFATLRNTDLFAGNGNDTLHSFTGDDYLDGGEGLDTASYANLSAGVSVTASSDGTMTADKSGLGEDHLVSIEHIIGTNHNDTFTIGGNGSGPLQINGGAGNDVYTVTGNGAEGSAIYIRAGMGESTIEVLAGGGSKLSGGGLMYSTILNVSGAGSRPAGVELFTHEGHVTLDLSQVAGDTTIGELDRDIVADQLAWKVGTGADGYSGRGYFADGTEVWFAAVSEVILGDGEDAIVVANDNEIYQRRVA